MINQLADNPSSECRDLFKKHDPRPCCEIPNPLTTEENVKECTKRCSVKTTDGCCYIDCIYEMSGVIVDGVYSENKLVEVVKPNILKMDEELAKTWWHVLMKAAETCLHKCKKSFNF